VGVEIQHDSAPKKGELRPFWRDAFLAALRETGVVRDAAEAAGVDRSTPYKAREVDDDFRREWDEAMADASDLLIREAVRRARVGVHEPVIHQGRPCGVWVNREGEIVSAGTPDARLIPYTVTRYSDTLLIFLLKGQRPEYRDTARVQVAGDPANPVRHEHSVPDSLLARLDAYAAAFAGAADRQGEGDPPGDGDGQPVHPRPHQGGSDGQAG
jgi:hypothetical protein